MTQGVLCGILSQAPVPIIPEGGDYFSIPKIVGMLVLIFPWLYLAPKVSKDALAVRAPQALWCGLVLGLGGAGVLVWLLLPYYIVGMMLYVVLTSAIYIAYVAYRNGRVPQEQKILTAEHLGKLFKPKKRTVQVQPKPRIKLYNADSKIMAPPGQETTTREVETYNLTQDFLYDMLLQRASHVDVSPSASEARVRFVIDGVATERQAMSLLDSEAMIQYFKPIAGMNADERRRPQKGRITVDMATGPTEIALTATGTTSGQRMQFRIAHEIIQTRLTDLGMSAPLLQRVQALNKETGLIIASGRSGSGLTSTLYSLMRDRDAFTQQIVTFEKAPPVEMENITQNRYDNDEALPVALASALRRDPDVLMLDSCGSTEAAAMIAEAAQSKAILMGVSASDTFVALAKWVKLCGQASVAVQNLRGVLCQMLLRKLCSSCREAYRPDPQMLAKANLPSRELQTFYRTPTHPQVDEKGQPIICQTCQGNGYFGRTAAFELLEITEELRQLVIGGASLAQIKSACRKNKMLYLQEQALAKVMEGVTSIQEVIRVSQEAQASKK